VLSRPTPQAPMPQHYTKNTVEATIWCNTCRRETPWRILGGKRAYCIPCHDQPTAAPAKKPGPAPQPGLFDAPDSDQVFFN